MWYYRDNIAIDSSACVVLRYRVKTIVRITLPIIIIVIIIINVMMLFSSRDYETKEKT